MEAQSFVTRPKSMAQEENHLVQLVVYIWDWCNHIIHLSPGCAMNRDSCYDTLQQGQAPAGKDNGGLWPAAAHAPAQ